jgi:hypothetical protein
MIRIKVNRKTDTKLNIKCYICKQESTQGEYESHIKSCKEVSGVNEAEPDFLKYYIEKIKQGGMSQDEILFFNNKIDGIQGRSAVKHSRRITTYIEPPKGDSSSNVDKVDLQRKQRKKSMDDIRNYDIKQIRNNITNRYFL